MQYLARLKVILFTPIAVLALTQQPTKLQSVIGKIHDAYANCQTYRDSGSCLVEVRGIAGPVEISITFKTIFKRPGKLRFEFSRKDEKGRIVPHILLAPGEWRKGQMNEVDHSYTYEGWVARQDQGPLREPTKPMPLSLGIAGLTGVSSGVANTVPNWLMARDLQGYERLAAKDLELIGTEDVNKRACYVLGMRSGEIKMWFDKSSFLLVKKTETFAAIDTEMDIKVLYDPSVSGKISDSEFVFPAWVKT
jgi:outer membrane lipoprotein-sorting protein